MTILFPAMLAPAGSGSVLISRDDVDTILRKDNDSHAQNRERTNLPSQQRDQGVPPTFMIKPYGRRLRRL
ncbi:MAG TPA: hypothetical protein PLB05_00720 [Candidatus Omnitrophota bacterium]|nr:hypothetical protein [Candidatus Omnitrophota bacterium]HPN56555.1 hypothetical protein [Candidatus Omnitrophota bacterium]